MEYTIGELHTRDHDDAVECGWSLIKLHGHFGKSDINIGHLEDSLLFKCGWI